MKIGSQEKIHLLIYRITPVLKVETDIIASVTANPTGQAVMMYIKVFKTGIIVFIGN